MALGTNEINAVLQAWANSYIEEVPAIHEGGKYLIEYDALVEHLNNLAYDTLVDIMVEVETNYYN